MRKKIGTLILSGIFVVMSVVAYGVHKFVGRIKL